MRSSTFQANSGFWCVTSWLPTAANRTVILVFFFFLRLNSADLTVLSNSVFFFFSSEVVTEHLAWIWAAEVIPKGNVEKRDVLFCAEKLYQNKCLFPLKQDGYLLRLWSVPEGECVGVSLVLSVLNNVIEGCSQGKSTRNPLVRLCVWAGNLSDDQSEKTKPRGLSIELSTLATILHLLKFFFWRTGDIARRHQLWIYVACKGVWAFILKF